MNWMSKLFSSELCVMSDGGFEVDGHVEKQLLGLSADPVSTSESPLLLKGKITVLFSVLSF